MTRTQTILSWIGQIGAALILAQTLFFKFSGAAESVYIFSTLGVEPWGRLATGAMEAVVVVLLLIPRSAAVGALLGAGMMLGAAGAHLGPLGIEVHGDGGFLFGLALVAFCFCSLTLLVRRKQLPIIGARLP